MPGATLLDMMSTSLGLIVVGAAPAPCVADNPEDFLHGRTWNSLESGGIILTDLATLSLFLCK